MDNKVLNLTYASSLTKICEVNSSFDSGVLRIAYTGINRNGSFISKETFEKCMKTIFNCPVVCNYDRETDTLGGHDMEVVRDGEGHIKMINLTTPVGVIPESAKLFWEEVTEEDGKVHEYLCAEVLLWKRQEAYAKIKRDGVTAHSMEINVKDGREIEGVYVIDDFEFTAFALIGVTPCFESSALEVFSAASFKEQLSEMMKELKESFSLVETQRRDGDNIQNYFKEGGEQVLDKNELIAKYGIDVEALDFSIEELTYEELEEKLKAMVEPGDPVPPAEPEDKFALVGNVIEEVIRSLDTFKIQREWGECTRYWYADLDLDTKEVYCWDLEDWLLYGFSFDFNGDNVVIDVESKKRKKYIVADFDEGEQPSPFAGTFTTLEEIIHNNADLEAKYQTASETIANMNKELDELKEFKEETERNAFSAKISEVLAKFADLDGNEAFEELKSKAMEHSIEELEEKCFAIRGRLASGKFNLEQQAPKAPKIVVDREGENNSDEPYNGIFKKYGYDAKN